MPGAPPILHETPGCRVPQLPAVSVSHHTRGWPILAQKLALDSSASAQGWGSMIYPSRSDLCTPPAATRRPPAGRWKSGPFRAAIRNKRERVPLCRRRERSRRRSGKKEQRLLIKRGLFDASRHNQPIFGSGSRQSVPLHNSPECRASCKEKMSKS
jgi:hypothetical protein